MESWDLAMSASRTGNSDWLQQISWPLIGPPVILGATGAVRQVAPIPTFHGLVFIKGVKKKMSLAQNLKEPLLKNSMS